MHRKLRGLLLFLIVCFSTTVPALAGNISVKLNGYALPLSKPAIIQNDRVLVPMRSVMEALGYGVTWHETTKTIEATKGSTNLHLTIDSPTATVNNKSVTLDTTATLSQGTTMVPLRFVAQYSGATVTWDQKSNTVLITTKQVAQGNLTDSVVFLQTNKMQGSGIILSSDGVITTNLHVIEKATMLQVVFADGTIYQGNTTVIGLDAKNDIAILKIDKKNLIPAVTETSLIKGTSVTAVGAPNGARNTQTKGTLVNYDQDMIESSAVIDHGSSGGALFNHNGKVIGMTASFSQNQYFSIPISKILNVSRNLSMPIGEMKNYTYTPTAPTNLRYWFEGTNAYVTWSPVYDADYYYVYVTYSYNGTFTKLQNRALGKDIWYWGFPQCFGITTAYNRPIYIKVSAVRNGVETKTSEIIKINRT